MVPEFVEAIAIYVGLVRDIVLLVLLLSILIMLFFTYRKVAQALGSVTRLVRNTEDIVSTVSDNLVGPATAGSGFAFGLGKAFSFFRGMRGKRKGGNDNG